jgi:hypothetical protein
MYKLTTRAHPTLFVSALLAGLIAEIYFPHLCPKQLVEVPLIALLLGQVGLCLLLTLLFYEEINAKYILKLTSTMLSFAMGIGAIGNLSGQYFGFTTQLLPGWIVLINWLQVLIMNLTALLGTLILFQIECQRRAVQPTDAQLDSPAVKYAKQHDPTKKVEIARLEFKPAATNDPLIELAQSITQDDLSSEVDSIFAQMVPDSAQCEVSADKLQQLQQKSAIPLSEVTSFQSAATPVEPNPVCIANASAPESPKKFIPHKKPAISKTY